MLNKLQGYKTYIIAFCAVAASIGAGLEGTITPTEAIVGIIAALGLGSMKSALKKLEPQYEVVEVVVPDEEAKES